MPVFHYRAASLSSGTVDGELDAASHHAAIEELQRRGLVPIRVRAGRQEARRSWSFGGGKTVKREELARILRGLATLLDAGMPLDAALESLARRGASRQAAALVETAREGVRQGRTFADALAAAGEAGAGAVPNYVVTVVRAGEAAGALGEVLDELAGFLERSLAVETQVRSALIYPMLLLLLSVVSIIVFLTVVLPQFAPLFAGRQDELPALTAFFLELSEGFQQYAWVAIVVLLAVLVALRLARGSPRLAALRDRLVLRLPLFGDLVRQSETARLARTLGVLLHNGVKALPALGITQETTSNVVMRDAVEAMRKSLRAGKGLAAPMAETGAFPAIAEQLVDIGERSGKLDRMLLKLAEILEASSTETTKRLLTLLVPVLTLGSAAIIGLVVYSVFTALFSVYDAAF